MGFTGASEIKRFLRSREHTGFTWDEEFLAGVTTVVVDNSNIFVRILSGCESLPEFVQLLSDPLKTFCEFDNARLPLSTLVCHAVDSAAPFAKYTERQKREGGGLTEEQRERYALVTDPWNVTNPEFRAQFDALRAEMMQERARTRDPSKPLAEIDRNPFKLVLGALMHTPGFKGRCVKHLSRGVLASVREPDSLCERPTCIVGLRYMTPKDDSLFAPSLDPRFSASEIQNMEREGTDPDEVAEGLQIEGTPIPTSGSQFSILMEKGWTSFDSTTDFSQFRFGDVREGEYRYGMRSIETSSPHGGLSEAHEWPGEGENRMMTIVNERTTKWAESGDPNPCTFLAVTPDTDFLVSALMYYERHMEYLTNWNIYIRMGHGGRGGLRGIDGEPVMEYFNVVEGYKGLCDYLRKYGLRNDRAAATVFASMVAMSGCDYQANIPRVGFGTILTHMEAYGWRMFFDLDPSSWDTTGACVSGESYPIGSATFIDRWTSLLTLFQCITVNRKWAQLTEEALDNKPSKAPMLRLRNDALNHARDIANGEPYLRDALSVFANRADHSKARVLGDALRAHIGRAVFVVEYFRFRGMGTFMPDLYHGHNRFDHPFNYGFVAKDTPLGKRYVMADLPDPRPPKRAAERTPTKAKRDRKQDDGTV